MLSLLLPETKEFMNSLLIKDTFDNFSLVEASISTAMTTIIDGHLNKGFYSSDELTNLTLTERKYMPWSMVKPICFQIIKGKNTPTSFKITLSLSEEAIKNVVDSLKISLLPEHVKGLLVNFRYDGKQIMCTTATSLSIFTTDKTLDHEWDELFEKFLKKNTITSTHL